MKKFSSTLAGLAGCALLLVACGHTTAVTDNPSEREKTTDDKATKPAAKPAAKQSSPTGNKSKTAGNKNEADAVPVASSASQMLEEGALKDLQRKLQKEGMLAEGDKHVTGKWDAASEQALRRFQRDNDLPATGMPDRASAGALGLDPDELFKRAAQED